MAGIGPHAGREHGALTFAPAHAEVRFADRANQVPHPCQRIAPVVNNETVPLGVRDAVAEVANWRGLLSTRGCHWVPVVRGRQLNILMLGDLEIVGPLAKLLVEALVRKAQREVDDFPLFANMHGDFAGVEVGKHAQRRA
eukprot:2728414-Lingulodinium_polyedra.AAC.1